MEHIDFQNLIDQIPYERKLSDYNLHPKSVVQESNTHIPKPSYRLEEDSLRARVNSFEGCIISPVGIDDRYLACKINLNNKSDDDQGD